MLGIMPSSYPKLNMMGNRDIAQKLYHTSAMVNFDPKISICQLGLHEHDDLTYSRTVSNLTLLVNRETFPSRNWRHELNSILVQYWETT